MVVGARRDGTPIDEILTTWADKVGLDTFCRRKTRFYGNAEDLKQEIFLSIFERLPEFNPEIAAFETWAFNIMRCKSRSWLRFRFNELHPVLKKTWNELTRRASVIPIPEDGVVNDVSMVDDVEGLMKGIEEAIDKCRMLETNRAPAKQILRMMSEEKSKETMASELHISKSQLNAHIRRIRKAVIEFAETYPAV
jgi:RNA polymerase sigma factor (sigma-70 family)